MDRIIIILLVSSCLFLLLSLKSRENYAKFNCYRIDKDSCNDIGKQYFETKDKPLSEVNKETQDKIKARLMNCTNAQEKKINFLCMQGDENPTARV